MFLNGTIKIKGPEFEKKEIAIENKDSGEFYLKMDKAAVPAVGDFSIWIPIDGEKEIRISVPDLKDEDDLLYNYIVVRLKGKGGQVDLALSPEQAAALSQILQHYVTAFYEAKALQTERLVKSA